MSQVSMTVRMDSGLKQSFDSLCSQFGMSANTAMNIFAKAVVQRGKIPFEIRGDKPVAADENEGLKAFRALRAMAEAAGVRLVEIVPSEDIGGAFGWMGVFDPSPETANRLIELGRSDARNALREAGLAD